MNKNQRRMEELGEAFSSDIKRLDKMTLNIFAVNNIQFIYGRLMAMKFEASMEFFMEVEALTTGLVVAYGRLFGSTTGTAKLNENIIPEHLRPVHVQLMQLRHQRYAHHGDHHSIETSVECLFDGERVTVNPRLEIGFWVGASKDWKPFIDWFSGYMLEILEKQLAYLSAKSGQQWTMNYGDPPAWA